MTALTIDGCPVNVGRHWTGITWIYAGEFTDEAGRPVRCQVTGIEPLQGPVMGYGVRVGRTAAEVIDALRQMPAHLRPQLTPKPLDAPQIEGAAV